MKVYHTPELTNAVAEQNAFVLHKKKMKKIKNTIRIPISLVKSENFRISKLPLNQSWDSDGGTKTPAEVDLFTRQVGTAPKETINIENMQTPLNAKGPISEKDGLKVSK